MHLYLHVSICQLIHSLQRYWKNPGAFREYRTTGDLGRFEGGFFVSFIISIPC